MKRLLFCVLLAGCATAPSGYRRAPEPDEDRQQYKVSRPQDDIELAKRELAENEKALAGATAQGQPVDCPRATRLGDNVCALAERICALVERLPRDPANTAQCTDARARCGAARQKVKAACPK